MLTYTRLELPLELQDAIMREPLVRATWSDCERAGFTVERAIVQVALELLADNRRMRAAAVERVMGRPPIVCANSYPYVVESAP